MFMDYKRSTEYLQEHHLEYMFDENTTRNKNKMQIE
jgi:hypothetical protein